MAIAFDQNLGTGTANSTAIPFTTSANVASGAKVIVVACVMTSTTLVVSGGGLTWTKDFDYLAGDGTRYVIASADAPSGLASSTTITATAGASAQGAICGCSFTGLAAQGSVVDQVSSGREQFNNPAWASNSITTLNAADLIFGFGETHGDAPGTSTPGGGYTEVHDFTFFGGLGGLTTMYQIVAATNTYNVSGTWSTAAANDLHSGVIGYKAATAAPGFTNTVPPSLSGSLNTGSTLTINTGTWSPTPGSFSYTWDRADDTAGTNTQRISTATGATYTLAPGDATKYIRAGVYPAP